MTNRDARIPDDLDNIKYNCYSTKEIISKLVQTRATISLSLHSTYSERERNFYGKCYELIHNAMLEIIYMDREISN